MKTLLVLVFFFCETSLLFAQQESRYDRLRLENETMQIVSDELTEPVWKSVREHFQDGIVIGGEKFHTVESIENFKDVYFDTPDHVLLKQWGGLRHRERIGEGGEFKELVQMKLTPNLQSDPTDQTRSELKFEVEKDLTDVRNADDTNELLHVVKRPLRSKLKKRLVELGVEPLKLRRFLIITQERRRVYFRQGEKQVFTITLDIARCSKLWFKAAYSQLEVEIGENAFTAGDEVKRAHYSAIQAEIYRQIAELFPNLPKDQAPKVVKMYGLLTSQGTVAKWIVDNGEGGAFCVLLSVFLISIFLIPAIIRGVRTVVHSHIGKGAKYTGSSSATI